MTTPPDSNRRNGVIGVVLDRLLGYADRPWRVAAVVLSVLILGAAYAVWEQRATIAEKILEHTVTPRLLPSRFDDVAKQLIASTRVDVVILARANILANTVTNIAGRYVNDPAWTPRPDVRVVFGGDITIPQIVDTVEGRVVCVDVPASNGHRVDVGLGMRRKCWIGVPPIPEVLVGALAIGWKTPPDQATEKGARNELRRLATSLATW